MNREFVGSSGASTGSVAKGIKRGFRRLRRKKLTKAKRRRKKRLQKRIWTTTRYRTKNETQPDELERTIVCSVSRITRAEEEKRRFHVE